MADLIYRTSPYIATATAILLSLPPIGDAYPQLIESIGEYQPLDEISSKLVSEAVYPRLYATSDSLALFSLLSEVAIRLVKDSKSLDSGFAKIVDKEFWNLLK